MNFPQRFLRLNTDFAYVREIGRGAFGRVYLFRHKLQNQDYAVKIVPIHDDYEDNAGANVADVEREVQLLCQFSHENIVQFYCSWIEEAAHGRPYLLFCMAYVCGDSLRKVLEDGRLMQSPDKLAGLVAGCLAGLQHIHNNGIIHRDLKPENILLSDDLIPKIADFGIAVTMHGPSLTYGQGTAGYMAPEVSTTSDYDCKADIYSLGIVFYEIFLSLSSLSAIAQHQDFVRFTTERVGHFMGVADAASEENILGQFWCNTNAVPGRFC